MTLTNYSIFDTILFLSIMFAYCSVQTFIWSYLTNKWIQNDNSKFSLFFYIWFALTNFVTGTFAIIHKNPLMYSISFYPLYYSLICGIIATIIPNKYSTNINTLCWAVIIIMVILFLFGLSEGLFCVVAGVYWAWWWIREKKYRQHSEVKNINKNNSDNIS